MKEDQVDIDQQFTAITDAALGLEANQALDKTLLRIRTWTQMMRDDGQDPSLGALIRKCLAEDLGRGRAMAVMCAAMARLIELEDQK